MFSGPNVKPPGPADTSQEKDNSRAFVIASSGLHLLDNQLPEFMRFGFAHHRAEYVCECIFLLFKHTVCECKNTTAVCTMPDLYNFACR